MTIYTVNSPGSPSADFKGTSISIGDKLIINRTGSGRSGSVLDWRVPYDGIYTLEAWGARGGGDNPGKGARMKGDFELRAGDQIKILIGHMGETPSPLAAGGGGGTFVVKVDNESSYIMNTGERVVPLLIAGGGGGNSGAIYSSAQPHGQTGQTGGYGRDTHNNAGSPGSNGEGGNESQNGHGGGGFLTSGTSSSGGSSFLLGGVGGYYSSGASGGFGGGGGTALTQYPRGGGGGGYSGGGGARGATQNTTSGATAGGGGSYNTGTSQSNSSGVNSDHGKLEITFLSIGNEPPTQPESFIKQPQENSINLANESINLSWGESVDPEGDSIKYTLEFYNGSSWNIIASNLTIPSFDYTLPSLNISNAQFRVRAIDSNGGESSYRTSNGFTIRKQLILIQDDGILKTFKNGSWEII